MKTFWTYFILFFLFQACAQKRKEFQALNLTSIKPMGMKSSNQAVSEGYINDKIYLYSFGGLDSTKLQSGIHQRCFRFDITSNIWEEIESLPDTLGKIALVASRVYDTIYIIGGYHVFSDGSEKSSNKVHRFDIKDNRFVSDGTEIPVPIDDHVQAVWKNRLIYVISGWSNNANVSNVQIYNPVKDRWFKGTPVPDNNIYKSFGASGTIIGDTIYYFGGASMGKNYPIQNVLRKGIINPENPSKIKWTYQIIDSLVSGYRMASLQINDTPHWIGGSSKTYNYSGIAYDGSGGVRPNHRILSFKNNKFYKNFNTKIPMDLRGICVINDSVQYLIGGMGDHQQTLNQVSKLEWE